MYSYHSRVKQRIRNGELLTHYRADNYPGIGEALVLVFYHSADASAHPALQVAGVCKNFRGLEVRTI